MKTKTNNLKLVFYGVLIFILLIIIVFTILIIYNYSYEKKIYNNPFYYPYTDEEYLCIDNINKTETNDDLEKISEQAIISAIKDNNQVPDELKNFISKDNFDHLKAAGYNNQSVDINDYHVSYIECKCYNSKAVITFITSYEKGEYMSELKNNIYYDKLYLEKSNDCWYVFKVFTGP